MISELPTGWKWVTLNEISEVTSSRRIFQDEYENQGIPFFRTKEIKELNEGKNISVELFITHKKYDEIRGKNDIPEIGDILMSAIGTIGVSYIVKDEKPFYFKDGNVVWIRKLDRIISKYLFFCFEHFIKFKQGIFTSGSAYNALTIVKLKAFKLPLPPKDSQQAIVSKIEELFSELDKGIENLRLAQQQLKTYRQCVLKWAFEGRLTNENVKDRELPEGWGFTTIEEVASVGTGATPLKSNQSYYGGGIPWVTSGALNEEYVREATDFVTAKAVKETNLSIYSTHTLLVAMYGEGKTRGKCSELLIEACTNQAIAAIHFDKEQISIKPYLKYFLLKNYDDVRKKSSGGVQPNLNLGIIKKLRFPLASANEQKRIIQEIESRLSIADKMEESINQSLRQAEALRQSILKKAFEGKLTD